MKTIPNDEQPVRTNDPKANPDAITGAPGSHPVGTGAGAAGAGLAGAALGTLAGPVGSVAGGVVGAVIGAVAGGLVGKAAGEAFNPTEEARYWQDNHATQPFAADSEYAEFANAYRAGYEGHSKYASGDKSFDVAEPKIRQEYEMNESNIAWSKASSAARAAWARVEKITPRS